MSSFQKPEFSGNSVLMLALVSASEKRGWLGITKLQKLAFLIEYTLNQDGKRAFGYNFFMHNHGPISKGLYNDYEAMLDEQLIVEDENGIQVSEIGKSISEQFLQAIPKDIQEAMKQIVKNFAHMKTHELRNYVHAMNIIMPDGSTMRVDNILKGSTVLQGSLKSFKLEKSYSETFAILANKKLMDPIRAARKHGSTCSPYKPLST